jgi:hypothetical protein
VVRVEGNSHRQVDARLARLATRQHGVVSRRQLLALGLDADRIWYRLEVGRSHLLHRGVYAVGHTRLTQRGHWLAAVAACRAGCRAGAGQSVLSHRAAGSLHGVLRSVPASPIDVTATGRHQRHGLRCHRARALAPEDVTTVDAIPVTTVAQPLLDLTRRLRAATDLPQSLTNVVVEGETVDFFWPDRKLIVETDGDRYHRLASERAADARRDRKLTRAGYTVLRVTGVEFNADPDRIIADIRAPLS